MLKVLLADAGLELPPPDVAGHPAIRKHARSLDRRPTEVLLDQNMHRPAINRLPDAARRGRPDIVHVSLLVLLESPLCKAGGLEVAVHTRDGLLVQIRPDTRLPRGEARFQGLMAKVLLEGRTHEKDPLLWVEARTDPAQALAAFAKGEVVRLDEAGTAMAPADLADKGPDQTLVLGAFPSGPWSAAWQEAAPQAVSLWPDPLNAWAIASECVAGHRARWGPSAPAQRKDQEH